MSEGRGKPLRTCRAADRFHPFARPRVGPIPLARGGWSARSRSHDWRRWTSMPKKEEERKEGKKDKGKDKGKKW